MISPEQLSLKLSDFSTITKDIAYDRINLNKPIGELSLSDLNWCIRKRCYLEPATDLILDTIHDRWHEIDKYYIPMEISQWFDETARELVLLPLDFWDTRHTAFSQLRTYIAASVKREIPVPGELKQAFLCYKPKDISWTLADHDCFLDDSRLGMALDITGNVIRALELLKKVKHAILNGQSVFIESEFKSISTEEELLLFIASEYADEDDTDGYITEEIKREKKIKLIRQDVL